MPFADRHGVEIESLVSVVQGPLTSRMTVGQQSPISETDESIPILFSVLIMARVRNFINGNVQYIKIIFSFDSIRMHFIECEYCLRG